MAKAGASEMFGAAMSAMLAFVAGYITTPTAQNTLNTATEVRYLAPTDVFAFFMLAALFFDLTSKRFPIFKEYPAVCLMFASSSIADILLRCRGGFTWIVYAPSATVAFIFVIPDCVHRFLFNGVEAIITWFGWIGTSPTVAAGAMAIHNRLEGIPDEELPV